MNEIEFQWPPKELSPNARLCWQAKSRAVKKYRADCFLLAKMSGLKVGWEGPIHLFVDFHPPSRARFDGDNIAARFKAGADGIAEALGVNDVRFVIHPFLHTEPCKGGKVVVKVCQGDF